MTLTSMTLTLILLPLEPRGVRIAVVSPKKTIRAVEISHTDDLVDVIARVCRAKNITRILVHSGVGSFSASRSCLVVATMWGALRGISVRFTGTSRTFQYAVPPHITAPHITAASS